MKQSEITIEGRSCLVQRSERSGRAFVAVFLKGRKGHEDGLTLLATDPNEQCAIRAARRRILMGGAP